MKIGDTVRYPDGEFLTLLDVDEGLLSANAVVVRGVLANGGSGVDVGRVQIPLTVRFMHPGFLFQRVGFIPS